LVIFSKLVDVRVQSSLFGLYRKVACSRWAYVALPSGSDYVVSVCDEGTPNPNVSFKPLCGTSAQFSITGTTVSAPTIDSFSINGYSQVTNGVIQAYNMTNPTVSWSSSNASYCMAGSTDFATGAVTQEFQGKTSTSGSQQLMIGNSYYNQRNITLTCYNTNGVPSGTKAAFIGGKG